MPDLAWTLIDRFTSWATRRDDIRAAILVGSRARSERPADAWSDVDLLVFTSHVGGLRDAGDWVSAMGPVVLTFLDATQVAPEIVERRALYATGLDVDYVLLPAELLNLLTGESVDPAFAARRPLIAGIFRRGFRVLLDRDNRLGGIDSSLDAAPATRAPAAPEFANVVNDFWFHALWTARKLCRGETLMALNCCDVDLNDKLITIARWHALAGDGRDTWHQSRFFEEWADPRLVQDLTACFAHYDPADIARALRATMRTFDWIARETAARLGFEYPHEAVRWITARVDETLEVASP